jgi:hypothetical protein
MPQVAWESVEAIRLRNAELIIIDVKNSMSHQSIIKTQ